LCCGSCYYFHERMELLPVAEGNHDAAGSADHADADREHVFRIYDRLWYADGRRTVLFRTDNDRVLRSAEAVCRRYYRRGKIKYLWKMIRRWLMNSHLLFALPVITGRVWIRVSIQAAEFRRSETCT